MNKFKFKIGDKLVLKANHSFRIDEHHSKYTCVITEILISNEHISYIIVWDETYGNFLKTSHYFSSTVEKMFELLTNIIYPDE